MNKPHTERASLFESLSEFVLSLPANITTP